jgi:hypothetical protein
MQATAGDAPHQLHTLLVPPRGCTYSGGGSYPQACFFFFFSFVFFVVVKPASHWNALLHLAGMPVQSNNSTRYESTAGAAFPAHVHFDRPE